jgi:predicted RNA-binding Zn-ribbon protein involved in translation (DUF1610 family)
MEYDSESGMLHCLSCGSEQKIEAAPEIEEEPLVVEPFDGSTIPNETEPSQEFEEKEPTVYGEEQEFFCKGCGASIVTEPEISATHCPYCGAAVAFRARLSGQYAPDKVIPFTVSKEEAKAFYKKWARNGLLTPKDFMTEKRLGEIKGIYVPFWLYDMSADAEADCLCSKKRSYRQGDYIYHETKYYHVYRRANLMYRKVPADASVKMDDETMDCLEPYDYRRLRKFAPEYLAGYQAEKYGIDAEGLLPRAKERVRKYVDKYLADSIRGYATTTYQKKECIMSRAQEYYALLPVWVLNYEYKGEKKTYTMNGQTGKIVGKPPVSKGRVVKWSSILYGGSFALLALITYLFV